jgi:hypothetical protein
VSVHTRGAPERMKPEAVSGFEFRVSSDRASVVEFQVSSSGPESSIPVVMLVAER